MKSTIKRKVIYICLTSLGVCALTTANLQAAEQSAFPGAKARKVMQTLMRNRLNFRAEHPLSAAQKQQVKEILDTHRSDIREQMQKAKSARTAFTEAADDDPQSAATLAAADQLAEAAKSRALLRAKIRSQIRPLLTDEQKQFADKARAEARGTVDEVIKSSD